MQLAGRPLAGRLHRAQLAAYFGCCAGRFGAGLIRSDRLEHGRTLFGERLLIDQQFLSGRFDLDQLG